MHFAAAVSNFAWLEARVSPKDIDVVHPGMLAEVRLTAFKQRRMPVLDGELTELSADRFTDERPIRLFKPRPSALTPTGYLGRTTIMEFLVMTDPLRRLVMQHADMGVIEAEAKKEGMRTMYEDGLAKAVAGITTIEEVLRVCQES